MTIRGKIAANDERASVQNRLIRPISHHRHGRPCAGHPRIDFLASRTAPQELCLTHTATLVASEQEARALVDRIGEDAILYERSVDLSEIDPDHWQVLVYFEEAPGAAERKALATAAAGIIGTKAAFAIAALPDQNWVARSLEGLKPVRAGRFLVHGRHDRARVRENDIAIEVEAGEAFGTGHHGTTAACLIAIDRVLRSRPVRNALDLGTGTGVLAIAITRAAKAPVVASDIDAVATRIAEENARLNGVAGLVHAVTAPGLSKSVFADAGPFDLIVANILAGPLVMLAPAIRRHLAPGGTVILSGLLVSQRARIVAAYRAQGLRLAGGIEREGWLTLTFRRAS
ncbi:MAG: 50S ribosomal protein L11 methyltransferase [Rhizobiales bacterium]|nr:50S ribosomal protein L11 methyltransferase [Hyphomicrobiales bacterium]